MSESASLVVSSLPETGGLCLPVRTQCQLMPVRWTSELLVRLDWMKLVELVRALMVAGGCRVGSTRIWPDGMADFTATQGSGNEETAVVMRLAPWNRWMASFRCVEIFAADLAARGGGRGAYLAPGGVSTAARAEGERRGIDLMDADELAATLNVLPGRHSKFFHDQTLAGQPYIPSCPVCLRPLGQSEEKTASEAAGSAGVARPDITYQRSDVVAERVLARRIEILRDCEIHFLREVRTQDMVVQGTVIGDFVCEGSLVLDPGAVLCGDVAARSVVVRPGAELRGETRILPGHQALSERSPVRWVWACGNQPKKEGCKDVCLLPHSV